MGCEKANKHGQLHPGANDDQRRVEVRVETDDDGRRQVILEDFSYGPGIGWYVQKTIRLDPQQVDALMGALCCAKQESQRPQNPARKILRGDAAKRIVQLADFLNSPVE
jgi:hypothetical protein